MSLFSVVATREFDLNGFYGERGHFFKAEKKEDGSYIIHDVLSQGHTIALQQKEFENTFAIIEDEAFDRYEKAVQEGDNTEIEAAKQAVI